MQSGQAEAIRKKIDTSLSSFDETCSFPTTNLNERIDILGDAGSNPSYIFSGA